MKQWLVIIVHCAAFSQILPGDFNQWGLADKSWTVAHVAAYYDNLPKDFNQWYLKNSRNETVFEIMICYNEFIPKWFKDWNLVITDDGETCKEIYERIIKERFSRKR